MILDFWAEDFEGFTWEPKAPPQRGFEGLLLKHNPMEFEATTDSPFLKKEGLIKVILRDNGEWC